MIQILSDACRCVSFRHCVFFPQTFPLKQRVSVTSAQQPLYTHRARGNVIACLNNARISRRETKTDQPCLGGQLLARFPRLRWK